MKKNKISNKTIALFAAALMLFAGGAFTGTQAVLNIFSPEHFLEFATDTQYVQIQENGQPASALLTNITGKVAPGKEYTEQISAKNTTKDAAQFVRIVIRKYWKDAEGNKVTDFEEVDGKYPELEKIQLTFANQALWQLNDVETTPERQVYYYKNSVPAGGVTEALTSTIAIDKSVMDSVNVSEPKAGVITYTYEYDGYQVCLEAEAQSIQTHNVTGTKPGELNAIKSIWGVDNVTSDGKTLKVN